MKTSKKKVVLDKTRLKLLQVKRQDNLF